jgi:multimeric flavodoxin WrbA
VIKLIGICGSRVKDGNMEALLCEAMTHAREQSDVDAEVITLWGKQINGCNQCNWCIKNQTADKPCVQDDDMGWVYPKLLEADGIILASPAHFGRLSGLMADLIDRTRAFVHGSVYQFPLKTRWGVPWPYPFSGEGGLRLLCQVWIYSSSANR